MAIYSCDQSISTWEPGARYKIWGCVIAKLASELACSRIFNDLAPIAPTGSLGTTDASVPPSGGHLAVGYVADSRHLAVIELRRAA